MFKKLFDVLFAVIGFCLLSCVLIILWVLVSIDTKSDGFFLQKRIGQFGKPFLIIKFKSIRYTDNGEVISVFGKFIRRKKLDELPQLLNIIKGDMSFVGPRPDVSGYYDLLKGDERKVLQLKPGITSLASLKYINEEEFLLQQNNPLEYNDTVIFPDKVKMNLDYFYCNNLFIDIKIIIKTILR